MTAAELDELLADAPVLFHMAERGSWPAIARHGLLSTSALLDLFGVCGAARDAIEAARRPAAVAIDHPVHGRAVIRDNKPMDDASLRRCLPPDLAPAEWYRLLNARVFFWLTRARLARLLAARLNRESEHDVVELDARSLVAAHRGTIELSPINSGATRPFPAPRGRDTFLPIDRYPYAHWRARRKPGERAVELAVPGAVPDITRHARRVVRMRGDAVVDVLWEAPPETVASMSRSNNSPPPAGLVSVKGSRP